MSTATATPDTEAIRTLLRRFIDEVLNGHDLDDALTELVVEDFVEQNPLPGQGPGRAGLRDVLAGMNSAFPDIQWAVQETVVEGDRIATFSFWTGTHRGEFMGIPATGRSVTVEAWTLDRYRDGQLAESRIIMDVVGLLTQLGVFPAPTND
ncbi:MAG TPA: ester cyclase [Frankiaceae bacterium]|nr:ester cyclase [Frankiaceae bacterium]